MAFEVRPLPAPLGAEVFGVDLSRDVSLDVLASLHRALRQYLVIVLRGHDVPTDEQLVRFGHRFGELIPATVANPQKGVSPPAFPEIMRVSNILDENGDPIGSNANNEIGWHTDYCFHERVAKQTFLEAVEVPPAGEGPQTCFISTYAAYETLPRNLREQLASLSVLLTTGIYLDSLLDPDDPHYNPTQAAKYYDEVYEWTHPAVFRHPDSGRAALYACPLLAKRFVGLEAEESDELLTLLNEHSTHEDFVYAHDWRPGDLAIFDTIGTIHRRDGFDQGKRRLMRQMSVYA